MNVRNRSLWNAGTGTGTEFAEAAPAPSPISKVAGTGGFFVLSFLRLTPIGLALALVHRAVATSSKA